MKELIFNSVAIATLSAGVNTSTYAVLASDAVLTFEPTVVNYYGYYISGSYFGFDTNGDNALSIAEHTAISQHNGLTLGTIQIATGSHDGVADGSESPNIDNPWRYFGFTGMHGTSSPTTVTSTGINTADIDFSGWFINWAVNGVTNINLGGGGSASVTCAVDCSIGDTYMLDYSAIVAHDDPSGFGGVTYKFYLEGTISEVPVPTAVWLFGSGFIGLIGVAKRNTRI